MDDKRESAYKHLRATAHFVVTAATPFTIKGDRFFIKRSELMQLERALTRADELEKELEGNKQDEPE